MRLFSILFLIQKFESSIFIENISHYPFKSQNSKKVHSESEFDTSSEIKVISGLGFHPKMALRRSDS